MHPADTHSSTVVRECRACANEHLLTVFDLGNQPAADHFPLASDPSPDPLWPLVVVLCESCGLVQLGHLSPDEELPRAVESATAIAHAEQMAKDVMDRLRLAPGITVHEYDSHHGGSWQPSLTKMGLAPSTGAADLVIDNHGMVHSEDFAAALSMRLADVATDGHFVIEFHHLLRLIEDAQFDTIRHGHPVYLTVGVLRQALAQHGFEVIDVAEVALYGGCVVLTAARTGDPSPRVSELIARENEAGLTDPERWKQFAADVARSCDTLHDWLVERHDAGDTVLGYGAPSKASLLLSTARVSTDLLPATADLASNKHGRRISGSGVPIISIEDFRAKQPDYVLVLTWDIAPEIVAGFPDLVAGGTQFFSPIPALTRLA